MSALQPRRQFLREVAKSLALHRAQAGRLRLGRRWAKRHDVGGGRRDVRCGTGRRLGGFGDGLRSDREFGIGDNCVFALGMRLGRRHEADRALATRPRQLIDAGNVAANAEAAIAAKLALAIEHRKAGQLDRKPLAALVHRPGQGDAAPGFSRCDRASDLILRIELQLGGDLAPQPAERGRGSRPHQLDELIGPHREAAGGIHLPDEAQRMAAFGDGLVMRGARRIRWRRRGRRCGCRERSFVPGCAKRDGEYGRCFAAETFDGDRAVARCRPAGAAGGNSP